MRTDCYNAYMDIFATNSLKVALHKKYTGFAWRVCSGTCNAAACNSVQRIRSLGRTRYRTLFKVQNNFGATRDATGARQREARRRVALRCTNDKFTPLNTAKMRNVPRAVRKVRYRKLLTLRR